jgi:predicted dehydrogenase
MSIYTVAIIGCGSIGALKDDAYDSPTTDAVLTHAHAFYKHTRTTIAGFIDIDFDKAKRAADKWEGGYCSTINEQIFTINGIESPDIVVVATPTETHYNTLLEVLTLKPKLVVAEKPFCSSLKEAREIHDRYKSAGIPLLVNYTRRFDPITEDIINGLRTGDRKSVV